MVWLTILGALESCGLDSGSETYAATDLILGNMVEQSSQPMETEAKKQREISRAYTPIPPFKVLLQRGSDSERSPASQSLTS